MLLTKDHSGFDLSFDDPFLSDEPLLFEEPLLQNDYFAKQNDLVIDTVDFDAQEWMKDEVFASSMQTKTTFQSDFFASEPIHEEPNCTTPAPSENSTYEIVKPIESTSSFKRTNALPQTPKLKTKLADKKKKRSHKKLSGNKRKLDLDGEPFKERARDLLKTTSEIPLQKRKEAFFEILKQLCPYIVVERSGSRILRTYLIDTRRNKRYRTYSDAIKGGAIDPLILETGSTLLLRGCVEEAQKRYRILQSENLEANETKKSNMKNEAAKAHSSSDSTDVTSTIKLDEKAAQSYERPSKTIKRETSYKSDKASVLFEKKNYAQEATTKTVTNHNEEPLMHKSRPSTFYSKDMLQEEIEEQDNSFSAFKVESFPIENWFPEVRNSKLVN